MFVVEGELQLGSFLVGQAIIPSLWKYLPFFDYVALQELDEVGDVFVHLHLVPGGIFDELSVVDPEHPYGFLEGALPPQDCEGKQTGQLGQGGVPGPAGHVLSDPAPARV